MTSLKKCKLYYEDSPDFLVEYRGDFEEEIAKVTYACGSIITNTIAIVSTSYNYLEQLLIDVPSIIFIDPRSMYVLQDISPSNVDNINNLKINPYLNLTGAGVLLGIVDTGIDYLNEEFKNEDGTSRIESLWDQTIEDESDTSVYIGKVFSKEQINTAIQASKNNQDSYGIVPSKDEDGHGTRMAGIIGGRGYSGEFQGVAHGSEFVIVKLLESINFKNRLKMNGVQYTPVYNAAEVLAAIDYLKNYSLKVHKPIVIFIGIGSTEGSHDGNNLISRYITSIGTLRGVVTVIGVGNEGASGGHTSGTIRSVGDISITQLKIPREIAYFSFDIWVRKPNRAAVNIISPTGESTKFIEVVSNKVVTYKYVFINTIVRIQYFSPEHYTGHQVIHIVLESIKPGIWQFQLRGDYISNGRYDIWLPPVKTLPPETNFLEADPYITLTVPSTARKVVTVAYYGNNNALMASSGKGFNTDGLINPDIITTGVNVITTKVGGGVVTDTGSSVAAAVVAGACAILLQWGIVEKNDSTMYSTKIRSYLIYGADRSNAVYRYPSRDVGYGSFDLLKTFDIISRTFRSNNSDKKGFLEYYCKELFIRIPI
ncbi:S8 family peptidase [Clostridium sp. SHJSY1]|uniref:S8 family peptidase n=1 Tax=Clostridium sp. SHJSY1 TaxID=2942483 RepID=UPI0028768EC7|nr:S8 family peptidase [Clostridium sp. SHJSY1]MDS0528280.1 S8 family peptidase [Clostridium sp. SHJSY1]